MAKMLMESDQVPSVRDAKPEEVEDAITKSESWINKHIIEATSASQDISIRKSYENAGHQFEGYSTLDWGHFGEIFFMRETIKRYIADSGLKRPLNIVIHSEPGAGKTFLAESLAKMLKEQDVVYAPANMTAFRGVEDLLGAIDEVRNIKAENKFPLLFLDEFDSDPANYALLLPLLWDGSVTGRGRTFKIGRTIIVLAGSKAEISVAMKDAKSSAKSVTSREERTDKLIDLVSRINGGDVTIPPLEERPADKICLMLALMKRRLGSELTAVPWALLKFVSETKFRHGVRSMNNLADAISRTKLVDGELRLDAVSWSLDDKKTFDASHLPMHLAKEGRTDTPSRWKKWKDSNSHLVHFSMASNRVMVSEFLMRILAKRDKDGGKDGRTSKP